MATYTITSPSGKTLKITGDVPPTEQELDEIFAKVDAEPKKGIDLTPSGWAKEATKRGGALLTAPFVAAKQNIPFGEAYKNELAEFENAQKALETPLSKANDFLTDTYAYSYLPFKKFKEGANLLQKATTFGKNALIQGGVPGLLEGVKAGDALGGAGTGTITAAAVQGALSSLPFVGRKVSKFINNPNVQNGIVNTLEAFTSVPKDYTELAVQKELSGNSIFKKPFDAKTAYIPVEQKLRNAKNLLPNEVDFGNEYYQLGQKALKGMDNLEQSAGAEISKVLEPLNDREFKSGGIQNAVKSVIDSYGKGGIYNSAKKQAPRVVNFLEDELSQEGLTLMDLHRIKKDLYNMGYAYDEAKQGVSADVARKAAEQINNYLRSVSPSYAQPNDVYSMVLDATKGLTGAGTIGDKISNIGSVNSAKSGLDQRLKAVDNLLPQNYKFYNEALNVINAEKEINQIKKTISKQYERNPRLLGNRTDEAFENAINDLQNKTGVNFMDELQELRAREALEKLAPGQGGGSGGGEGFMNNYVRPFINSLGRSAGGALIGSQIGGPLGAVAGLAAVSPKFAARGTIKNLGRLNNLQNFTPPEVIQRILPSLYGKTAPLYGQVEYNEYR